jgi:hypothetical protein
MTISLNEIAVQQLFRETYKGTAYPRAIIGLDRALHLYTQAKADGLSVDGDVIVNDNRTWRAEYDKRVIAGITPEMEAAKAARDEVLFGYQMAATFDVSLGAGIEGSWNIGEWGKNLYTKYSYEPAAAASAADARALAEKATTKTAVEAQRIADETIRKALSIQDPDWIYIMNELFAADTNHDYTKPAEAAAPKIFRDNPTVASRIPQRVVETLTPAGTCELDEALLKTILNEAVGQHFTTLTGTVTANQQTLAGLEGLLPDIHAYVKDEQSRIRAQQALAAERKDYVDRQGVIDGAAAALGGASAIVALIDKDAAHKVNVVGKAASDVASAINKFTNGKWNLGSVAQLANTAGALGTAALAGNIAGAITSVVALFTGPAPSPEQVLLNEIKAEIASLRGQVSDLHNAMRDYFNRISEDLDTQFDRIDKNFAAIQEQLWVIRGDIAEVSRSLSQVAMDVRRLYVFIEALEREAQEVEFLKLLNFVVPRFGADISFEMFTQAENAFHAWAVIESRGQLQAGGGGDGKRPMADDALAVQLNSRPPEANINYILDWIAEKEPALLDAEVPAVNASSWALGARAYAQLLLNWPNHALAMYGRMVKAQERLKDPGEAGRQLLRSLALMLRKDMNGAHVAPALVLNHYIGAVKAVVSTIDRQSSDMLKSWRALPENNRVQLQDRVFRTIQPSIPATIAPGLAGVILEAGDLQAGGGLHIAFDFKWVDITSGSFQEKDGPPKGDFQKYKTRYWKEGAILGTIRVSCLGIDVASVTAHSGQRDRISGYSQALSFPSALEFARRVWEGPRAVAWDLKQRFEASPVQFAPLTQAQHDMIEHAIRRTVRRRELEQVLGQLGAAPLVNDLLRVDGARALLEHFCLLVLPHATRTDDWLRHMLTSGGGLPSGPDLANLYNAGRHDATPAGQWIDPLDTWVAAAEAAASDLSHVLRGHLTQIDTFGVQQPQSVVDALLELGAAEALIQWSVGSIRVRADTKVRYAPEPDSDVLLTVNGETDMAFDGFTNRGSVLRGEGGERWYRVLTDKGYGWVSGLDGQSIGSV